MTGWFLISAASYPYLSIFLSFFSFDKRTPIRLPRAGTGQLAPMNFTSQKIHLVQPGYKINPAPRQPINKSSLVCLCLSVFRFRVGVQFRVCVTRGGEVSLGRSTNGMEGSAQPALIRTRRMGVCTRRSGLPTGSKSGRRGLDSVVRMCEKTSSLSVLCTIDQE